jgi:protein ImuA
MTPMAAAIAFPAPAEGPSARIDRLRRKLCAVEAATGLIGECVAPLALGIPLIDATLGGGLSCGALHEIAAARESEIAAATGFALALTIAARNDGADLHSSRGIVWIAEDLSLAENGAPYGPGLDEAGSAPERLVTVAAAHGRDVLWAMEEALRCRAVGVVIGELRARGIDQVATRRLSLAAAAGDTLGLILRTAPDDEPSAAATRWIIGAAPSSPLAGVGDERFHGIGPSRLAARLVRNRRGHLGAWIVEWNSVEQRFELATHSEPVAGAAFDRPHQPAVA